MINDDKSAVDNPLFPASGPLARTNREKQFTSAFLLHLIPLAEISRDVAKP